MRIAAYAFASLLSFAAATAIGIDMLNSHRNNERLNRYELAIGIGAMALTKYSIDRMTYSMRR